MTIIRRDSAAVGAAQARALAETQAAAVARINAAIGAVRERYITIAPGQDMIYAGKADEATAVLAAAEAGKARPAARLLMADVRAGRAETLDQAAQIVTNLAALWTEIAAATEETRARATDAIWATTTAESAIKSADAWLAEIGAFDPKQPDDAPDGAGGTPTPLTRANVRPGSG